MIGRKLVAMFSCALFASLTSAAIAAQPLTNCGPHADLVKALSDKFGETPSATALTNAGGLLEVLAANDGSTWTILLSRPDGLSCVVAAGEDWQDKPDHTATAIDY